MDRGAWWATVCRAAKSQTQLKWLSTHVVTTLHWRPSMSILEGTSGLRKLGRRKRRDCCYLPVQTNVCCSKHSMLGGFKLFLPPIRSIRGGTQTLSTAEKMGQEGGGLCALNLNGRFRALVSPAYQFWCICSTKIRRRSYWRWRAEKLAKSLLYYN